MTRHQIERVRHETRLRTLTVSAVEPLTPRMLRVTLSSPELHDFVSAGFDDHLKLLFGPMDGPAKPPMRDFTPRRFDTAAGTLVIDFALHEAGPAAAWATSAKVGDTLDIGGPRGSAVIPDDFDWYLLIGDEAALPAIGRRVEELRSGVSVTTIAIVEDPGETQTFTGQANCDSVWRFRSAGGDDAAQLLTALDTFEWPTGEGFVWLAAESSVARALRDRVLERGHPREWLKAAGYWTRGAADTSDKALD